MSTVRPLWAHQERALNAIASRFAIKDRCQLIMAPGTGKTLVSLRLAEKLARPGLVVVAVPTIALLGQTMAAYMADCQRRTPRLPGRMLRPDSRS